LQTKCAISWTRAGRDEHRGYLVPVAWCCSCMFAQCAQSLVDTRCAGQCVWSARAYTTRCSLRICK